MPTMVTTRPTTSGGNRTRRRFTRREKTALKQALTRVMPKIKDNALVSAATGGVTWAIVAHDTSPAVSAHVASGSGKAATQVREVSTNAPDWTAVANKVRESVVAIAVMSSGGSGEGSGVVLDAAGHVLTNNHVVNGAQQIKVTLADGRVYDATVVGTDPTTDLAVVAITNPPSDLTAATFGNSDDVAVGDAVMAVGNPLGLDSTVTTGIVSALDRPVSTGSTSSTELVVTNAIQVDAAINPGNSGGALATMDGKVVGVNTLIESPSGASAGIGFAIPIDYAMSIADQLIKSGKAVHPLHLEGQIQGAAAQGIGRALWEGYQFDAEGENGDDLHGRCDSG